MNRPINKERKPKVMVAVPCMKEINYRTVRSLFALPRVTNAELHYESIEGSLVYIARNDFCEMAVTQGYDYIMFIDSDMVFPSNVINKLIALDADVATAVCYGRTGNHAPQVYSEMKPATWFRKNPISKRCDNVDGIFEIKGCGMACCLIGVGLIREMLKRNIRPFEPFNGLGEDFAFCVRARKLGAVMLADGSIPIGHIGEAIYTKEDWVKDTPTPL